MVQMNEDDEGDQNKRVIITLQTGMEINILADFSDTTSGVVASPVSGGTWFECPKCHRRSWVPPH